MSQVAPRGPERDPKWLQETSEKQKKKHFQGGCYTACFCTSLIRATRLVICFWMGWWGFFVAAASESAGGVRSQPGLRAKPNYLSARTNGRRSCRRGTPSDAGD
eukprot:3646105-Pyramimonas_sp.AAC.1